MTWTGDIPALSALDSEARAVLDRHQPMQILAGTVLFRPGDSVKGFVILLEGRIGVHLIGPTGRDILLYDVVPGKSCIQSTLGLLGGEDYSAEGVASTDCRAVLLPRPDFLNLLDRSASFRALVFAAFAERMQSVMQLVEQIAFTRLDARLARLLLVRETAGVVATTHADLARELGSAREVVSRKLDAFARKGLVRLSRGQITLTGTDRLAELARDAVI